MKLDQFMDALLAASAASGIEAAEVYAVESDSFSARATEGALREYKVSSSAGVGLRGMVNGRMGYAGTQAFDDEAVQQMIQGVLESAELNEAQEQDEIFAGDEAYPRLVPAETDIDSISAQAKLDACMGMDRGMRIHDPRVTKVQMAGVSTQRGHVYLRNSYGLNLSGSDSYAALYCYGVATEGNCTTTGGAQAGSHQFSSLDPAELAKKAALEAVSRLHGTPVSSGSYRIILDREAMSDLLSTFCGMFSAEAAQQQMSLLAGKEGTVIASPVVTLIDDPLLPGGLASTTFDAEGSATSTKEVISAGTLNTLLHDRKTARKQGVKSTGNAVRAGYSGPVHVGPTNLYLKPGTQTPDDLIAAVDDGLLITEVTGLHAGANPISGDFSLASKGFRIEHGRKGAPVEQITVAGNFYALLKEIRAVANDLRYDTTSIFSPTVDAGEMTVSGT